ncbi:tRNA dihydrouridine(20/20a) synthase DusA [Caviibacter abscessus]|uniref:tRNA dihydrouridine(20/20a) synthase DusA n=1 Tax=Caviibacter abscessus TaxID=1766719 RepID=UPI0008296FA8|nr:tRNA dihydrouridine(20/20a) synthase DusA [Caviibacter abscessus]
MKKISIAPMVDRTTNHFRDFIRLINKDVTLYTEMITDKAIINGDEKKLLEFNEKQQPLVLQIATSSEKDISLAMKKINKYDYSEIDVNAGCPSNRVSDNKMGAYLMSDIEFLCKIVREIKNNTDKPVTVKHRIGIDGTGILKNDKKIVSYEELLYFIDKLNEQGVNKFIIHSRIAILKGLTPDENRKIPKLDYGMVYKVKKDRPHLNIEINGGIKTMEEVHEHLKYVDSVMIGRAAYDNPMLLNVKQISYEQILEGIIRDISNLKGKPYHYLMHTLGLFYGTKYSKLWKNCVARTDVCEKNVQNFLKTYFKN